AASFQLSEFGCLTVSSIGGNGVFAFIVKRFRVFRAPLQLTRSGHVRFLSRMGSTSSANGR
ncbi:hypothetical protein ABLN67_00540, partial [Mycobacterium tuberculosis]